MNCLSCHADVTNGLALCDLCQRKAQLCFELLPVYFRNLARWRPGRSGTSRPVPGSRVLYDGIEHGAGTGDRISDRLDETNTMLVTWADVLVEARPYLGKLLDRLSKARSEERVTEAEAVAWLCLGFSKYLTSAATTDWCGEFVRDLSIHEDRLRRLTESTIPGWYAGACRHCGCGTYVVPGFTWVTCGGCGATTYARDHLEIVLNEARDWVARPKAIAEAIVALVDTEQSVTRLHERIKKWEQREKVPAFQRDERAYAYSEEEERVVLTTEKVGAKRYRLGDVLDVLFREGETRTRDAEVQAS